MKSITEYMKTDSPFEYAGITADDHMMLDEIVGKDIVIQDVKTFENDKGPGVYMLVEVGGRTGYICTHAVGLVKPFNNPTLVGDVKREGIDARIIKRKSLKSDRMVYAFA